MTTEMDSSTANTPLLVVVDRDRAALVGETALVGEAALPGEGLLPAVGLLLAGLGLGEAVTPPSQV